MSYRTFKRVLGETSLERKCRWWFGVSLVVLLTLSFYLVRPADRQDRRRPNPKFIGPELVRAGWLEAAYRALANRSSLRAGRSTNDRRLLSAIWSKSSRDMGRKFEWDAILPQAADRHCRPRSIGRDDASKRNGWPNGQCRCAERSPHAGRATSSRRIASLRRPRLSTSDTSMSGRRQIVSVLPADVRRRIVRRLPSSMLSGGAANPHLKTGDLMAVVRVTTDHRTDGDRGSQEPGAVCGRRRSSSVSCRCSRCGPSCAT